MLTSALGFCLFLGVVSQEAAALRATPEARAVAFLSREVPRWSRENHCYSCHNNGDAARALYQAASGGYLVPEKALADTTLWLTRPADWDHNGGEGPSSDKRLARLAFVASLATAVQTGHVKDTRVLRQAARRLVLDQSGDGAWHLEGEDSSSSPAAYGRALATLLARESLFAAGPAGFRVAIERADLWLMKREIVTLTDAAVSLLSCGANTTAAAAQRRDRSLDLLSRGQGADGGWGPHLASPSEPFDTALALLGLSKCPESPRARRLIRGGRAFLVAQQQEDGGWTETTRPPGGVSYAQRISTSGWATLALLATRGHSADTQADPKR